MKRIVDPKTSNLGSLEEPGSDTTASSDIELKELMDKCKLLLFREIKNLLTESALGASLSKDSSQALVNYVKLLKELIKDEKDLFDGMSDEELETILKSRK